MRARTECGLGNLSAEEYFVLLELRDEALKQAKRRPSLRSRELESAVEEVIGRYHKES